MYWMDNIYPGQNSGSPRTPPYRFQAVMPVDIDKNKHETSYSDTRLTAHGVNMATRSTYSWFA